MPNIMVLVKSIYWIRTLCKKSHPSVNQSEFFFVVLAAVAMAIIVKHLISNKDTMFSPFLI